MFLSMEKCLWKCRTRLFQLEKMRMIRFLRLNTALDLFCRTCVRSFEVADALSKMKSFLCSVFDISIIVEISAVMGKLAAKQAEDKDAKCQLQSRSHHESCWHIKMRALMCQLKNRRSHHKSDVRLSQIVQRHTGC